MDDEEYHLIGDEEQTRKPDTHRKEIIVKIFKYAIILSVIGAVIVYPIYYYNNIEIKNEEDYELLFIKEDSRKDKYGIELNKFVLDGIYCVGFDDNVNKTMEDWSLYTPPCPNLKPIQYPKSIIDPDCDNIGIQFMNFKDRGGTGVPYTVHLHSISHQLNEWEEWVKRNETNPLYCYRGIEELVDDKYYPFDYGYKGDDSTRLNDIDYYTYVVNSRMDEVPDPRRRRLFSFILFNSEFDLLDLYLTEYYDIMDYFVIYEANTTFTGHPKPLYFTRCLLETDRYDKFKDKLIPFPVQILIDEDNGRGKAFPREHNARRLVIAEGLKAVHARHGDLFMHGDLDEMMKPHVLTRMKKCGGWEHLQAGIGGGPKSFKDKSVESYIYNPKLNVTVDHLGNYQMNYYKDISIGGAAWFYEYSFTVTQNATAPAIAHPNIGIFDARLSLGQFPELKNIHRKRREYSDPLLDPDFDPYQGYLYTDNTNDLLKGKGYTGEYFRFATSRTYDNLLERRTPVIWSAAWHMSSFLPTIEHIYNKLTSYSHFNDLRVHGDEQLKEDIKTRVKEGRYVFEDNHTYSKVTPILPKSYKNGYPYNFEFKYWKKMESNNGTDSSFQDYINMLYREVPQQVWKNPICYAYMLDREYGIDKKLWYEKVPKEEWKTVRFEKLDKDDLDELIPPIITDSFKSEMLKELAKAG
jgi:hypothetical protein